MTFRSTANEYCTPSYPKGSGAPRFTVEVFTKNLEGVAGQGAAASMTFSNLARRSCYRGPATDLRQLVHPRVTGKDGTAPPTGQEGVVCRILLPTWYDKAV